MNTWPAAKFIEHIDAKYIDAKRKNLSRMDVEWGKWSREMNIILRDRINSKKDPEELRLKYVITYWTLKSQILELYHKSKLLNAGKIRKRKKEVENIREAILTGKGLKEFELDGSFVKKMMG